VVEGARLENDSGELHRVTSRLEFCQLVEMGVVMREIEAVCLRARKDEEIRKWNRHA
jgi:hypothetical protein